MSKTGGGVGSNQYRVVGRAKDNGSGLVSPGVSLLTQVSGLSDVVASWDKLGPTALKGVAADPTTPVRLLEPLYKEVHKRMQAAASVPNPLYAQAQDNIINRPDCPRSLLIYAGNSQSKRICELVAKHPGFTPDVQVATRDNAIMLATLIWDGKVPPEENASHKSKSVRLAVARHPDTSQRVLEEMTYDRDGRIAAVAHGRVGKIDEARLFQPRNATARKMLAERSTDGALLSKLATASGPGREHVHRGVASNVCTPSDTLELLSNNVDLYREVARNPSTAVATLEKLTAMSDSQSVYDNTHLKHALLDNPNLPVDTIGKFIRDSNPAVVDRAGRHLNCPSHWAALAGVLNNRG